jgi:hypothetical protein
MNLKAICHQLIVKHLHPTDDDGHMRGDDGQESPVIISVYKQANMTT